MRIANYEIEGTRRLGAVHDGEIRPLPAGAKILDLLAMSFGEKEKLDLGQPLALSDVRLRAPLNPTTIRDFITFEEHLEGARMAVLEGGGGVEQEWYEMPMFYFTNPHAVTGPHDEVPVPPGCGLFDFELEVAAVIGKAGHDLTPDEARDHIAGYMIFNDWSARDLQAHEMRVGLGPAKGKDTANTLGPWIVTADELEPYRRDGRLHLEMTVFVNGEKIGDDTLANMAWSFEEMTAYASRGTWVRPGDVLGSGTCGHGCLAELWGRTGRREPRPLEPGDVVTMTVEEIGEISNEVVEGVEPVAVPRAQPAGYRRERRVNV